MASTAQHNLGPQMSAVIWTLLGFSGLFLGLRLYCKCLKSRGVWWDDYVLVVSWAAFLVSNVCITVSISLGFGKHAFAIDPAYMPRIQILGNVSGTFSILAAVWSKTSFGITLLRLLDGNAKLLVWFIIVSMNVLMTVHALTFWIQCGAFRVGGHRQTTGRCLNPSISVRYGVAAAAYSGVMDVLLAFLPWSILWNLRMKKLEKIGVAAGMSMGIFAGCTAFVKSAKISLINRSDFTYEGYNLVVWASAEIGTTIMAASVPFLRTLVRQPRHPTPQLKGYPSTDAYRSRSTANIVAATASCDRSVPDAAVNNRILRTRTIDLEFSGCQEGVKRPGMDTVGCPT